MDPARDLPQPFLNALESFGDAIQVGVGLAEAAAGTAACAAQVQPERDELLLGLVVEVTLDLPSGLVGGGNDPAREAVGSSARLSAFAIAVATSSVKAARRVSVSGGIGCSRIEPAIITPQ